MASSPSTMASRPIAASAAPSVMPPFSAARRSIRATKAEASAAAPSRVSYSLTQIPPARCDLGDAAAHGPGADDAEHEIGRSRVDCHSVPPMNAGNRARVSP